MVRDMGELPACTFDHAGAPYNSYVILTSRGCPYNCHYCSSKVIWGRKVRYRPAELVVREVVNLKEKTGLTHLRFGDDTFTLSKKHMQSIADGLRSSGVSNLSLSIGSRIDTINEEKLDLLKQMNVTHISFGVETGSDRMVEMIDKKINLEDVVPTVRMVNNAGITTTTFFIINHAKETRADMLDTESMIMDLKKNCRLNVVEINVGFPYPSTPWWEYCKENNLLGDIDFYRFSHRYNHQQKPAVNMTLEPEETLLQVLSRINRMEMINGLPVRLKKAFKMMFRDPRRFVTRILGSDK